MNFREELEKAIGELDELFDAMKKQYADRERDYGVSIYQMIDSKGSHLVMPVLTAKANALAALASLPTDTVPRWAYCNGELKDNVPGRHPLCFIDTRPHDPHMVRIGE